MESKIILFNDMLNQKTPKTFSAKDTAIEDLHGVAKSSQKKLMEFIASNEDEDRMGT
jgi:hypothetical protein